MEFKDNIARLSPEESQATGLPESVTEEDQMELKEQFIEELRNSSLGHNEIAALIRRARILMQIEEEFGHKPTNNGEPRG